MDFGALLAPITLPIASLFAIPLFSSWSTSLNLVFFSLTWSTIALTYAPLQIEFFAPMLLRTALYLLPAGVFLAFDCLVPSLALELKAQGEGALPLRQPGGRAKLGRVVSWAVFNVVLAIALQAALEWLATDVLHIRSLLAIKAGAWSLNHLPNPWTMAKHLLLGLVLRNALQFYIHRNVLHAPNTALSRLHRSWHHSILTPYSFVAAYDHPVCYLLHRVVPLYLPAVAFRFHLLTYLILVAVFSLEELFVYSGYNVLPSTIMLRGMARRVDGHMMSQGEGNFAPVGVLDWCHGTTLGSDIMDDLRGEMDKHHVQQRAGKVGNQAGEAMNGAGGKLKQRKGKGKT